MKRILLLFVVTYIAAACSRPKCHNLDPVLDQYGPNDQPYKAELLRVIQKSNPADLHYIIDKYVEMNNRPYASVYVHGDSVCAQMFIDLKNPNKMAHFKTVKGISFSGSEIKGLQFAVDTINGVYDFVFEEGKVID